MIKIKGFTLVEMVVCIVIMGIVIFSIYSVVISANKSYMKLYKHSKNKNDVLYLNNLMRNSLESTNLTMNFCVGTKNNKDFMQVGYYDNNFGVNNEGCYRVDYYEFSESGILKEEEKGFFSTKLDGEDLSNLKIAKTADLYLTVYQGKTLTTSKFDSVTNSTTTKTHVTVIIDPEKKNNPLIEKELIFKNVNKVYYYLKNAKKLGHKKFFESGLYMLIIHDNELNGENKEYYADYFTFKNSNFYTANFSTYTYVIQ